MPLHIVQSRKTPELFGFAANETGDDLPIEDGPWENSGNAIPLGIIMPSTSPEVDRQIERNEYALVKGHSYRSPICAGVTASREQDSQPPRDANQLAKLFVGWNVRWH